MPSKNVHLACLLLLHKLYVVHKLKSPTKVTERDRTSDIQPPWGSLMDSTYSTERLNGNYTTYFNYHSRIKYNYNSIRKTPETRRDLSSLSPMDIKTEARSFAVSRDDHHLMEYAFSAVASPSQIAGHDCHVKFTTMRTTTVLKLAIKFSV